MRAEQVLLESRRRVATLDDVSERSRIEAFAAAATLSVLGPADELLLAACEALRDSASAAELGRVAADMDLDIDALNALVTRAAFSPLSRRAVFGACCHALAERGAIAPASAALVRCLETSTRPAEDGPIVSAVVTAALGIDDFAAALATVAFARSTPDAAYCRYLILDRMCQVGRVDEAAALLKKIRHRDWRPGAVAHVAVARVRRGEVAQALELLLGLDPARVSPQLVKVAAALIAAGRADAAFDAVERLRSAVGANRPRVLEQLLVPLIAHGEHARALATVAELGDARSAANLPWMTVLAGVGRRAEAEALAGPGRPYITYDAIAVGVAASGDILEALRIVAAMSLGCSWTEIQLRAHLPAGSDEFCTAEGTEGRRDCGDIGLDPVSPLRSSAALCGKKAQNTRASRADVARSAPMSLPLPGPVEQCVRDHLAALSSLQAIEWSLRTARETGGFATLFGGEILERLKRTDDASLVDQVAAAFAEPPFTPFWRGQLFEQSAWQALARRDTASAHRALLDVLRHDPSRAPYLAAAWGRLAARMLADGRLLDAAGVDALFASIGSPVQRALAWTAAARDLALLEQGRFAR